MKLYYALSAIGQDRPGIVADVSGLIFECGGNLEDSSMTILGNQFALLILLSGSGEEFQYRLSTGCKRLEWEKHLSIFLTPVEEPAVCPRPGRLPSFTSFPPRAWTAWGLSTVSPA